MGGIGGAIGKRSVVALLLEGRTGLEARGYDSAGMAVLIGGRKRVRADGRVAELEKLVAKHHSYEAPEFMVLPVVGGSRKYLNWLAESVAVTKLAK